jgi:hypothetical protein
MGMIRDNSLRVAVFQKNDLDSLEMSGGGRAVQPLDVAEVAAAAQLRLGGFKKNH